MALLIAVAAAVPVVAALLIEILPGLLGSDLDPGRLTQPAGYHNALALIAVAGVIGTASSGPRDRRTFALAGAAGALFLTALALTLSRGGVLALIVGLALLFVLRGRRGVALGALLAGLVGASIPIAWGLSRSALTDERVPVERAITPRPRAISGKVAFLDISKPRGNVLIDRLQTKLAERLPGVTFNRYAKPTFSKPAPDDLRMKIQEENDFVIEALAD